MTRFTIAVLAVALAGALARAADPPRALAAEERKQLEAKWLELNEAGDKAYRAGRPADALQPLEGALAVARKLYPEAEFKEGHLGLAQSLCALGAEYRNQGKLAAAEPLLTDGLEMRKRLLKGRDHPDLAQSLNWLALLYRDQGQLAAAEPLYKDALAMRKRLCEGRDHFDLAQSLNNLGLLYRDQGQPAAAEPLIKGALEMRRRLFKGQDHFSLPNSLGALGFVFQDQGKLSAAEPLFKEALEMNSRLFKGQDNFRLAISMNNLGLLYQAQGKLSAAEPLLRDTREMLQRLFQGQDHPELATSLNNLGLLYQAQGKPAAAEPLLTGALDMLQRLFQGQDHPGLATSRINLGLLYHDQGKLSAAEPLLTGAPDMFRRLFKGQDHPHLARSLNYLGFLYMDQGKLSAAEPLFKDSLAMHKRLTVEYAGRKSEGEALTFAATQPLTRDAYLSLARKRAGQQGVPFDAGSTYAALWTAKGTVARVFEHRQARARAASTGSAVAAQLDALAAARRRRAELLVAPVTKDPGTLKARETELKALDDRIAGFNESLPKALPAVARLKRLDGAALGDLQAALPADAALVDYVRYTFFEWDNDRPFGEKTTKTWRYVAFVVTRADVVRVDLGTEAAIRPAVRAWRAAITGGKPVPAEVPAKVREQVWDTVRKTLPATTKTVYVCPDADLCGLPFSALPGDKPGTIVLEEFAVATVPHAPFLLDKLWPGAARPAPPTGALVVGGVKYDADVGAGPKGAEPLVKPGARVGWGFLPNTVGELNGVTSAAAAKKIPVTRLEGERATTAAVLESLPQVSAAHFATHGFFADPSFRGLFELDEKDFAHSRRGERIGRAANSPLVMTGLVFAGANRPQTPGRGIVTGEALIDRDLSGLELAVLSACETGLGDLGAGGEGVFGLQRAFHYAGATNVVCSLWKVPDESTAALMNLFYTNLWGKNLSALEALRRAQLEVYRNPQKVPELAQGFRGKFERVPDAGGVQEVPPPKDGKAHPVFWAAFTLSGPGR
ncbi:CHAT domain-containing tetratricopeptide repeat protein [Frigoriglobus tundricola]|uniref:CHAT domain-containing protein n=1 Tax=Frigoriglobus tundricola TaxID=2774151 RepID=A0A6M5YLL6_9BACT|nr:CHAT domain-containing tetratricopeptide repeat protein [Frigoriglobus tundricola]QJW94815.1 hypothetical protein FTUN_2339 [Frigoriglobus tundricola]